MSNKLLVVIGGPTGIGKTALAILLARHYKTAIVSADSRQVYKELNIGVGRPSPAEMEDVPHHLIAHTSIFSPYSVADYTRDALTTLEELFHRHNIVFLTGGTGLYVKAILEGIDDIPEIPEEVTLRWTTYWKENGTEALAEALHKLDPEYHAVVDQANPRRLIRAITVCDATGRTFTSYRKGDQAIRPFRNLPVLLDLPRSALYEQIDRRVKTMIDMGWEQEARALDAHRQLKALHTVGYKELFDYFDGHHSLPQTIAAIQQSTRRYAKRQITWWRHQGNWHTFSPDDVPSIINAIDLELDARSKGHGAER